MTYPITDTQMQDNRPVEGMFIEITYFDTDDTATQTLSVPLSHYLNKRIAPPAKKQRAQALAER